MSVTGSAASAPYHPERQPLRQRRVVGGICCDKGRPVDGRTERVTTDPARELLRVPARDGVDGESADAQVALAGVLLPIPGSRLATRLPYLSPRGNTRDREHHARRLGERVVEGRAFPRACGDRNLSGAV